MVTGAKSRAGSFARRAIHGLARLPWRGAQVLPWLPQRRVQLLLGPPPLGPEGVWSALDPYAIYGQQPSTYLVDLALDAAREASRTHLSILVERATTIGSPFSSWAEMFPGEHYRLLAGLTRVLAPRLTVEIGTYTGASALAFLEHAVPESHVVTYDIIPWGQIPGSLLRTSDFSDGRLEQRVGDLADSTYWAAQRQLFLDADIIFLDGPKDDLFEPLMLKRFADLQRQDPFLLVVDDIRFLEMLGPWARFPAPKLDLTSFGHWSGTGLALVGPESRPGHAKGGDCPQ